MDTPLNDDALATFAASAPDVEAARALRAADVEAMLALVSNLAAAKKREHLEALGAAGLDKRVKKAARRAAYGLKSAGVAGASITRAAIDLSVQPDLEGIAVVFGPALHGQLTVVAADLPGLDGFVVADGGVDDDPECDVMRAPVSRGWLKRIAAEESDSRGVVIDAGAAVRMIDHIERLAAREQAGRPVNWSVVADWRGAAVSSGADPAAADARAQLARPWSPSEADILALFDDPRVGRLRVSAPEVASMRVFVDPLTHDDAPIDREGFEEAVRAYAEDVADAWFARDGAREHMAACLDANADVLYVAGDEIGARAALALADRTRAQEGDGRTWPLLVEACARVIDIDRAWAHRLAHIEGHAQHG